MSKLIFVGMWAVLAANAFADPYWIAYEADDVPENVGWQRVFGNENGPGAGGAERSLLSGALQIDSLRSVHIYDFFEIDRPINPDPNELFIAEWRVRVLENHGPPGLGDNNIVFARDGGGTLAFEFMPDRITSSREDWSIPLNLSDFHSFRISSANMVDYSLWIDGTFARNGQWDLFSLNESFVAFGDGVQGIRSLAQWDYVRFGVVPEPSVFWMLLVLSLISKSRLTRKS